MLTRHELAHALDEILARCAAVSWRTGQVARVYASAVLADKPTAARSLGTRLGWSEATVCTPSKGSPARFWASEVSANLWLADSCPFILGVSGCASCLSGSALCGGSLAPRGTSGIPSSGPRRVLLWRSTHPTSPENSRALRSRGVRGVPARPGCSLTASARALTRLGGSPGGGTVWSWPEKGRGLGPRARVFPSILPRVGVITRVRPRPIWDGTRDSSEVTIAVKRTIKILAGIRASTRSTRLVLFRRRERSDFGAS